MSSTLEKRLADLLDDAGIAYTRPEREERRLDFYLPDLDLAIEVKGFLSERLHGQLEAADYDNVMVLIGPRSIDQFEQLVKQLRPLPSDAIDLSPTEEVLNDLADRIDAAPYMGGGIFGSTHVSIRNDRMEAVMLRSIVATARSNYDAFHTCLNMLKKETDDGTL